MSVTPYPDLVINGVTIPHRRVADEVQNHKAPPGKPGVAWRKAAIAIAIRTLLLQEAERRNIAANPLILDNGMRETEEEALVRALLEEAIIVKPPTAEEVKEEWQRDPARFKSDPLWEVSHILIACDRKDAAWKGRARLFANGIQAKLREGADFIALAKEASACPSGKNGGYLGQVRPGDTMPEFEAAIRKLKVGETSGEPALTSHGWHIIHLHSLAEGQQLPFETVRHALMEAMEKSAWAKSARQYVATLVAGAEISGAGDLNEFMPN